MTGLLERFTKKQQEHYNNKVLLSKSSILPLKKDGLFSDSKFSDSSYHCEYFQRICRWNYYICS